MDGIIFAVGLAAAATLLWGLTKLDERTHPRRDQRKSSWWVWAVAGLIIAGGLFWMASSSGPVPYIADDEREWLRR